MSWDLLVLICTVCIERPSSISRGNEHESLLWIYPTTGSNNLGLSAQTTLKKMLGSSVPCSVGLGGVLDSYCQQELIRRWLWSIWEGRVAERGFPKLFSIPTALCKAHWQGGERALQAQHAPFQSTVGQITSPKAFPAYGEGSMFYQLQGLTLCFVLLSYILSQVPEADPRDAFPAFDFQMSWGVRKIQAEFALRRCSTALPACSPRRAAPKEHSLLTVTVCKL